MTMLLSILFAMSRMLEKSPFPLHTVATARPTKIELFRKLLEWTTYGALISRECQGKFEARQIVIHGDLSLNTLGIEDLQEAGRALAEAQLSDAKRFLRLL